MGAGAAAVIATTGGDLTKEGRPGQTAQGLLREDLNTLAWMPVNPEQQGHWPAWLLCCLASIVPSSGTRELELR